MARYLHPIRHSTARDRARVTDPEMDLTAELVERIAEAIHEQYRRNQAGRAPPSDPSLAPWSGLIEPLRASSRSQAVDIPNKLRAAGCIAVRGDGNPDFAFTSDEVERLAELEHRRWVAERRANGWSEGPRDPARRQTPFLVPYGELPEEVRELDRQAVRAIPTLLRSIGLEIRRA